jgi:hypothetical protein
MQQQQVVQVQYTERLVKMKIFIETLESSTSPPAPPIPPPGPLPPDSDFFNEV